jgi:hypothetical protein
VHSRPTALELIEAVSEHLERDVVPSLSDPRVRFQTLVSVHALSIVARELARGSVDLKAAVERLSRLGLGTEGPDLEGRFREGEEALARRIRGGELGESGQAVLNHVRETLLARLRVASPDFRTEKS